MPLELNKKELAFAEKIISIGMKKASEAMTFFTREKVLIKDMKIEIKDFSLINKFSTKITDEPTVILTTQLIGELSGYSYLLFSKSDVTKFSELCIPKQYQNNSEDSKKMLDSLLLEIDNILSASVITQFSNLLKVKIYGGVPDLKILKTSELSSYISDKLENPSYMLCIDCDFSNNNTTLNPQFIWLLDAEFLSKIKEASNDNTFIETVNQQYNSINDNRAN